MKTNGSAAMIIELATKAKTEYLETLSLLKDNDLARANESYEKANGYLLQASELHLKLHGQELQVSLLLVCGEDLLAMANLYQSLMVYFSDLHRRTQNKKERQ